MLECEENVDSALARVRLLDEQQKQGGGHLVTRTALEWPHPRVDGLVAVEVATLVKDLCANVALEKKLLNRTEHRLGCHGASIRLS